MPGMDRRWARRAQCPRAQQDLRSTRALNGRGHCIGGSPGIHAGEDVPTIAEPEFPDSTDWCYRFEAREGGTLVMESCVLTENQWPHDMQAMIAEHGLGVQQRMQQTLERLKTSIEARR